MKIAIVGGGFISAFASEMLAQKGITLVDGFGEEEKETVEKIDFETDKVDDIMFEPPKSKFINKPRNNYKR